MTRSFFAPLARLPVILLAAAALVGCAQHRIPDGPPLQLHQQLSGQKFTYDSPDEQKVWSWFSLNPAFASTLERHPTALEEAGKAPPFRTASWITVAGGTAFGIKALVSGLRSVDDLTSDDVESVKGDLAISSGFFIGSIVFDAFARRYLNRAISLFNAEEARSNGHGTEAQHPLARVLGGLDFAPTYTSGRGAGLVARVPLR